MVRSQRLSQRNVFIAALAISLLLAGFASLRLGSSNLIAQGTEFEMTAVYNDPISLTLAISDALGYGVSVSEYVVHWSISGPTAVVTPTTKISLSVAYDGSNGDIVDIRERFWLSRFRSADSNSAAYAALPTTSTLRNDWTNQLAEETAELLPFRGCQDTDTCPDPPIVSLRVIGTVSELMALPDSSYVSRVQFLNGMFLPGGAYDSVDEPELPTSFDGIRRAIASLTRLVRAPAVSAHEQPSIEFAQDDATEVVARHGELGYNETYWAPIEAGIWLERVGPGGGPPTSDPTEDESRIVKTFFDWPIFGLRVYKLQRSLDT